MNREPFHPGEWRSNGRTLKNRIRRLFYLSSIVNVVIFCAFIGLVTLFVAHPVSKGFSNFIATQVAREMHSPRFLQEMGIRSLDEFDDNAPGSRVWKASLDQSTKVESFLPFFYDKVAREDLLFLRVQVGDRSIYSSMQISEFNEQQLANVFNVSSSQPVFDMNGEEVGMVTAGMNPKIMMIITVATIVLLGVFVMLALSITRVLSLLFTIPILKPIEQLEQKFKALAAEEYEYTLNSKIMLKKPLRELESLADSTNTIMQKMKGYTERLQEQNEELEAQNEELTQSKHLIQEAQEQLMESQSSLRSLLNNAGQGFLTFGPSLRIDEEYSVECAKIFGREVQALNYPELLGEYEPEQRAFWQGILVKVFQEPEKRELYLPLLTDELQIGERSIRLDYKIIPGKQCQDSEQCMVILTDVTEKRALQSQVETERNMLKMIVKVVVQYGDFSECVREFKQFLDSKGLQMMERDVPLRERLLDLYRELHTFKGNFSQLGLVHTVSGLHEAEAEVSHLLKRVETLTNGEVFAALTKCSLRDRLHADLVVLEEVLGAEFFHQEDLLTVDKAKLIEIEKKMLSVLSPVECKVLLPELRKLRYKSLKEMLRSYPEYVNGLSERLERLVHPFEIEGDDVTINTDSYADFSRALVHVFRNIVDHGIEPVDEREELGKDEYGRVRCVIDVQDERIVLTIADDGRGIDADEMKERALERGVLTEAELAEMQEQDLIELIFRDEFSTKETVTELSGRGIGLSAVKYEVDKLGGEIAVWTSPGVGTSFRFTLPNEGAGELPQLDAPEILATLAETTKSFFGEQLGMELKEREDFMLQTTERVQLHHVSSFIGMKGAFEAMFVMSMEEPLSKELLRKMVWEELPEEEEAAYLEDSLAETSNVVLGNSIRLFRGFEENLIMEPPATLRTEGASIKYADSDILTLDLDTEFGTLRLGLIVFQHGHVLVA